MCLFLALFSTSNKHGLYHPSKNMYFGVRMCYCSQVFTTSSLNDKCTRLPIAVSGAVPSAVGVYFSTSLTLSLALVCVPDICFGQWYVNRQHMTSASRRLETWCTSVFCSFPHPSKGHILAWENSQLVPRNQKTRGAGPWLTSYQHVMWSSFLTILLALSLQYNPTHLYPSVFLCSIF